MVLIHPRIKEQLKILRKISYNRIKRIPAGVVDLQIGQLKPHDMARALFVVTSAFAELTHKQDVIMKVLKQTTEDIKKLIDQSKDLSKEQVVDMIKQITLEPENPEKKDKVS